LDTEIDARVLRATGHRLAIVNQSLSYSSLWSVRGRFGIIASDVFHFYGTAGIGGAKANYTSSASFNESGLEPSSGDHVSLNSVDVIRVRASYLFNWWNR
jgi:opacity protein-like surface antigen